jgi:hypothetical protein
MTPGGKRALLIGGALLGAALLWGYGVPFAIDFVGRGRRLTRTELDDNLSIADTPEELAAEASATLGRYVDATDLGLARMVRSEEGDANDATKAYLVHVAMNDAQRKTGGDVLRVLTLSSVASRSGKFGKQTSRRYSTRSDPYERDLLIAEAARAEWLSGGDRTDGARKFYHKQLTEIVGVASFDKVKETWAPEGLYPFTLPDTPVGLVFFGPNGERDA